MILGLLAFLVIPLLGPFAIGKGNEAKRLALRARAPVPTGATVGLVLGWLATVGLVLGAILLLAVFFLTLAAS
ncbi:MAG: hypothetical protein D6731_13600 [Planctomycetota bacterium]|nr:MAG: hypothetical protein D6731_13600 [Planctomycetota bacterium]